MDEVFDVQAALKDHPESEVAAHVAQLHGIDRDAYLKGGQTDAEFLSEFGSKTLPSAAPAPVNLSEEALASRNDPLNTAGIGAIAGGAAAATKKGYDIAQAIDRLSKGQPAPAAPAAPEPYVAPGQKYKAKTGFGAGEGESVREVSDEWKRLEAEKKKAAGHGKISSRLTGGTPDEILARARQEEAELANQARIRAEQKIIEEAKNKAAQAAALEKKLAHEAEQRFRVPNAVGKMLPVAGATAGYNIQDVINQDNPVQKGIAAVGAAGSAAPFIKKLPPKLRAAGVGASLLAPVINRSIDAVQENKATGGLIQLAKGSSVIKKSVELAKGVLPRLPRAPAKSDEELYAIAQRMAPQQLGHFTQLPGETKSVAGKSRKQFEREQQLVHDIEETPHQLSDLPDIDYSKRMGAVATGLPGDKSGVATIKGVAGIPLEAKSVQEGGAPYGLHYQMMNPDLPPELWASTGQAARNYRSFGNQVAHQYDTEDILPHYMSMPQGMGYAQHLADVNLKGLRPAGADLNKLTDLIRKGEFKGKTFQDFPGFENMDQVYDLMKHNPELRQYFNNRLMVQKFADSVGLPPTYGLDTLHAVTMPGLRDVETGAGGNVIGKLDLRREMTPTAHNTYTPGRDPGLNIPGEVIGSSKYLMPYDLMYADSLQAVRANPDQAAQEFGSLKMTGPRQVIDQQFVDEIGKYRDMMKKLTGMATGGSVLPDVSIDARSVPNMTGMPGVGYMQAPQGAMARLQLQKDLEEAKIRAGVSGMAMALPGQQGVKTMPGQMDIGANVPVGPGRLDVSANRSINPIPGRGHMQGVNARYTIPFAEGGSIPSYGIGGKIIKGALSLFKGKADDVASKYHPLVQKGLAEGRIHPNDAQWMSDYAHTPGRAEVETGGDGWKDQSEKMRNFVGRMERGEVPIPQHFQGPGGVNAGGNTSGLNIPPVTE